LPLSAFTAPNIQMLQGLRSCESIPRHVHCPGHAAVGGFGMTPPLFCPSNTLHSAGDVFGKMCILLIFVFLFRVGMPRLDIFELETGFPTLRNVMYRRRGMGGGAKRTCLPPNISRWPSARGPAMPRNCDNFDRERRVFKQDRQSEFRILFSLIEMILQHALLLNVPNW